MCTMQFNALPYNVRHTFKNELKAAMLVGIYGGALIPFVAIVGRKIGATDLQVALLTAAPYLANAFALLWTEDVFGKGRVWYVVWPNVVGRLLLLGMFFAVSPVFYTAIIFIYMIITAIPFPSYASIMKTNYPDDIRGRLMAYIRLGNAVFWITSSAVAGWVLEMKTSYYRYLFPVAAVFGVLSALQFGSVKVLNEKKEKGRFAGFSLFSGAFRDKAFLRYLLVYSLFEFGLLLSLPLYPLALVDEVHISNFATGLFGSIFSGMWLAGFFFWGHFLDRFSARITLVSVFSLSCLIPLFYILTKDIYMLAAVQGIAGFMFSAIELAGYVIITRMTHEGEVARYAAANIGFGGLRGAIAPFLGIALMQAHGAGFVFSISLALGILSCIAGWNVLRRIEA